MPNINRSAESPNYHNHEVSDLIIPWKSLKYRLRRKIVRANLEPLIAAQSTTDQTLELDCGKSRYAQYFPNRIGLELVQGKGVDIIGDAHHLPIRSPAFSTVLTTEMLEHTQEPQHVVDEIARITQPGGKVILKTIWGLWSARVGK